MSFINFHCAVVFCRYSAVPSQVSFILRALHIHARTARRYRCRCLCLCLGLCLVSLGWPELTMQRWCVAARQRAVPCGVLMMLLNIALLIPSPFVRTINTLAHT